MNYKSIKCLINKLKFFNSPIEIEKYDLPLKFNFKLDFNNKISYVNFYFLLRNYFFELIYDNSIFPSFYSAYEIFSLYRDRVEKFPFINGILHSGKFDKIDLDRNIILDNCFELLLCSLYFGNRVPQPHYMDNHLFSSLSNFIDEFVDEIKKENDLNLVLYDEREIDLLIGDFGKTCIANSYERDPEKFIDDINKNKTNNSRSFFIEIRVQKGVIK